MPIVEFRGQRFQFPDAATPEQIQGALQSTLEQTKKDFASLPDTQKDTTLGIDFDFIRGLEGGVQTSGYIPPDREGGVESGVTVATGFDLGQWDEKTARNAGIPDSLLSKLSPYLGKRGVDAKEFLASNPLNISKDEAEAIDSAMKQYHSSQLASKFDKDSRLAFKDIPKQWQTVIASVAFQYGLDLDKVAPNFWEQVTRGKWEDALQNLRKFGDDYGSRRNREADYVEKG